MLTAKLNDYERLVKEVNKEVPVIEANLYNITGCYGLYRNGRIYIEKSLNNEEKRNVLAEEYGHYKTSVGTILNQNAVENRKQEQKARMCGTLWTITLDNIIEAWKDGCKYYWECAEFLGFSTKYVYEAVQHIRLAYGLNFKYNEYEFRFTSDTHIEIKNK